MRHTSSHIARRISRLAALAAFATALTGCQIIAGTSQYTQVRFINTSPDAPALDIYQQSAVALYNVGFGSISSYIPVAPGPYNYAANVTATQQQLAAAHTTFATGNQYTVLVGNISANLQMTVLKDESAPPPSTQVALRLLNQATRVAAVDVYLIPPSGTLATTAPFLTKVAFANSPAYIDVPSGTYSLVVLPTGTPTQAITTNTIPVLYSGNQVVYPGASARTIVLIDQPLSSPVALQAITADDYDSPSATS
jgi:hypothetical protein